MKHQHRSYIENEDGELMAIPRGRKRCKTSLTRPHRILIRICESLGVEWEDEKRFGRYSCDIYLPYFKIDLECDGIYWHTLPGAPEKDRRRDKFLLEKYGIKTIRVTDEEINKDKQKVFAVIKGFLKD
jgi:very-short-patch-repair endonuclease